MSLDFYIRDTGVRSELFLRGKSGVIKIASYTLSEDYAGNLNFREGVTMGVGDYKDGVFTAHGKPKNVGSLVATRRENYLFLRFNDKDCLINLIENQIVASS